MRRGKRAKCRSGGLPDREEKWDRDVREAEKDGSGVFSGEPPPLAAGELGAKKSQTGLHGFFALVLRAAEDPRSRDDGFSNGRHYLEGRNGDLNFEGVARCAIQGFWRHFQLLPKERKPRGGTQGGSCQTSAIFYGEVECKEQKYWRRPLCPMKALYNVADVKRTNARRTSLSDSSLQTQMKATYTSSLEARKADKVAIRVTLRYHTL